eukprot:gnl/TRDRNA2_/TRDRNA2_174887_c0_seq2.p1 gnl/TRDRNA2_/TRDRNA2_174887_c0~~gnl/TRDRNA2_/TRDRNA2_174887_c0_seq2.p1  ORF type:complete len:359 (+),score=35.15 gnl/TRDRNA2_/TRDRNA2_174887_c0_seq2:83-1078(+)
MSAEELGSLLPFVALHVLPRTVVTLVVGMLAFFGMSCGGSILPAECHASLNAGDGRMIEIAGLDHAFSFFGVGFTFLLVFKSKIAYDRWWEARSHLGGCRISLVSLTSTAVVLRNLHRQPVGDGDEPRWWDVLFVLLQALPVEVAHALKLPQPPSAEDIWSTELPATLEARLSGSTPRALALLALLESHLRAGQARSILQKCELKKIESDVHAFLTALTGLLKIASTNIPIVFRIAPNILLHVFLWMLFPTFLAYQWHMKLEVIPGAIATIFYFSMLGIVSYMLALINVAAEHTSVPLVSGVCSLPASKLLRDLSADVHAIIDLDTDTSKL